MLALPKRHSMIEQTTQTLRRGLLAGWWSSFLPSERKLAAELQVSRPTLRLALDQLGQEGLIEITHGRKTRILPPGDGGSTNRKGRPATARKVIFLILHRLTDVISQNRVQECRIALQAGGYKVDYLEEPYSHSRDRMALLATFLEQRKEATTLLIGATREQQIALSGLGARIIVLGSTHEGIHLPSVDSDYGAIGVHALQTFYRLGHRRIHAIFPDSSLAGDLRTEQSLRDVVATADYRQVSYTFSHTDGSTASLCRITGRLFSSRERPTALFFSRSFFGLTLLTSLMGMGLRVPADVSLISRDDSECFLHTVPEIAAYPIDVQLVVRKIVRAIQMHSSQNGLATHFIPKFEPRQTVGPAPSPL